MTMEAGAYPFRVGAGVVAEGVGELNRASAVADRINHRMTVLPARARTMPVTVTVPCAFMA